MSELSVTPHRALVEIVVWFTVWNDLVLFLSWWRKKTVSKGFPKHKLSYNYVSILQTKKLPLYFFEIHKWQTFLWALAIWPHDLSHTSWLLFVFVFFNKDLVILSFINFCCSENKGLSWLVQYYWVPLANWSLVSGQQSLSCPGLDISSLDSVLGSAFKWSWLHHQVVAGGY